MDCGTEGKEVWQDSEGQHLTFTACGLQGFPTIYFSGEPRYLPQKGTPQSAGYDLRAKIPKVLTVLPHQRVLVPTGVFIAMPTGVYGQITERSGYANREGLQTLAGVIDSDYRGEISAVVHNTDSLKSISLLPNASFAQIVFKQHLSPQFVVCEQLPEVETVHTGWGSTGK